MGVLKLYIPFDRALRRKTTLDITLPGFHQHRVPMGEEDRNLVDVDEIILHPRIGSPAASRIVERNDVGVIDLSAYGSIELYDGDAGTINRFNPLDEISVAGVDGIDLLFVGSVVDGAQD